MEKEFTPRSIKLGSKEYHKVIDNMYVSIDEGGESWFYNFEELEPKLKEEDRLQLLPEALRCNGFTQRTGE